MGITIKIERTPKLKTVDDVLQESTWEKIKRVGKEKAKKLGTKVERFCEYVQDHKGEVIAVGTTITAATAGVSKVIDKATAGHRMKKEQEFKERHLYDRSLGGYLGLNRTINSKDRAAIAMLREEGYTIEQACVKLGLLDVR